ncbi:MAG: ABC transporter ATP-binding protein/permease [Roseburia sp.]|nr:ABC transporter ATP-binding protein/permease [Roseburia sp.]
MKNKENICLYVLINILTIFFALVQAELFSQIISFALEAEVQRVLKYAVVLLGIMLGYMLLKTMLKRRQETIYECAYQHFREEMIKKFFRQPIKEVFKSSSGKMRENIDRDLKNIYQYYNITIPTIITNTLFVLIIFILILKINVSLGCIFLVMSVLQIIPYALTSVFSYKYYDADREAEAKWSENILSMYFGNLVIKIYELHALFLCKFKELNRQWDKVGRKSSAMGRVSEGINLLIRNILDICSYLVIGYVLLQKNILIDKATYLLVLTPNLFRYINSLFSVLPQAVEYKKAEKTIRVWQEEEKNDAGDRETDQITADRICIKKGDKEVIKNFSCNLDLKKKYFLVGDNGSGKTSIIEGLIGAFGIESGEIVYGKVKIEKILKCKWDDKFFYLSQKDALLDITAYDLFCEIDDIRCGEMLEIAADFGLTKENIYSNAICNLSGGERKKVYLSVALSMKEKFLFMDEPTNFLDLEGVELLGKRIRARQSGFLVVTHDANLLKTVEDHILLTI